MREVITATGADGRVLLTSFRLITRLRLRRSFGPTVAYGASVAEVVVWWLASRIGAPLPRWFDALQVPTRWWRIRVVDERLLRSCRRAGVAVHVWTVDDRADMDHLLALGVDGIFTNDPATLRAAAEAAGRW